jgi:hypothetical protein
MNISIDFNTQTPGYAMFSDLGNAAVHAIVERARADQLTWAQTYRALRALAEQDEFGEATDTAVRECVYSTLGFDDEPFYVR